MNDFEINSIISHWRPIEIISLERTLSNFHGDSQKVSLNSDRLELSISVFVENKWINKYSYCNETDIHFF